MGIRLAKQDGYPLYGFFQVIVRFGVQSGSLWFEAIFAV